MISLLDSKYFKLAVGEIKKDSPTELSCSCPACDDVKNRLHLVNVPTEDYSYIKCWNAGCELESPTSVLNFLKIINSNYITAYKREALGNKIQDIKSANSLSDILEKAKQPKPGPAPDIPLNKLFTPCTENSECVEYLQNRNITPQSDWFFSMDKYFTFEGKTVFLEKYLLIPIYNEQLKYRGFYSRSIKEKAFSTFLLPDTEKLWLSKPDSQPDIICEGIFDAISSGYKNSGAMLGADLSLEYREELSKNTIFAFDNDSTGTEKSIKYSKLGYRIFVWPELEQKDFNELLAGGYKPEDVRQLIEQNIHKGIMAETRLRMKNK